MTARIVLLVTSPRLPAGLLTAQAWDLVRSATVLAAAETPQTAALRAQGVTVELVEPVAESLLERSDQTLVWLAGPAGDEDLARDLGLRLAREPGRAELELLYGSWDPPGARLLDAVTVIDRVMAPDSGDPWKLEQTHQTLARYLIEEAYETVDAIAAGDTEGLREELGDVLFQVLLHAELAEDFTVDDVAGVLVDKLIRRNPHVFAGTEVEGIDEVMANWERIKQAEKSRDSRMDGIPLAQPSLALAQKVIQRARGVVPLPEPTAGDGIAQRLFALAAEATEHGLDADEELRKAALRYMDRVRDAEAAG
jgi:XTP/dITP diphosphohydrolase